MILKIKHFSELDIYELHELIRVRVDVFVVEQDCPYSELDGLDLDAYHLWLEDGGEVVAYLRVMRPGAKFEEASIGRVLCTRRRQGYASRLLDEGIRVATEIYNADSIRLEAQTYVTSLYEAAGFVQVTDEFLEDGIPHVGMLWMKK